MKKIIAGVLMVLGTYVVQSFLPWWSMAIVCFLIAYFLKLSSGEAFICGFVSIFLLWIAIAAFIDQANDHILLNKISLLFLHAPNILLIVITGVIGGLVGGLAGLSASYLRPKLK